MVLGLTLSLPYLTFTSHPPQSHLPAAAYLSLRHSSMGQPSANWCHLPTFICHQYIHLPTKPSWQPVVHLPAFSPSTADSTSTSKPLIRHLRPICLQGSLLHWQHLPASKNYPLVNSRTPRFDLFSAPPPLLPTIWYCLSYDFIMFYLLLMTDDFDTALIIL